MVHALLILFLADGHLKPHCHMLSLFLPLLILWLLCCMTSLIIACSVQDFHCHLSTSEVVGYLGGSWCPQTQSEFCRLYRLVFHVVHLIVYGTSLYFVR